MARAYSKNFNLAEIHNDVYDEDSKFIYTSDVNIANTVDSATSAIITTNAEHHEIHEGDHYYNEMVVHVPADDVLDIRIVAPDTTKWIHWAIEYNTEAEFEFTMYETIAITNAGTALTAVNNNRNSTNTTGLTSFDYITNVDLAAANADTNIVSASVIGQGHTGSGRSQAGASFGAGGEIVFKQGLGYCLRFENASNAEKYVDWKMEWYEHTNN